MFVSTYRGRDCFFSETLPKSRVGRLAIQSPIQQHRFFPRLTRVPQNMPLYNNNKRRFFDFTSLMYRTIKFIAGFLPTDTNATSNEYYFPVHRRCCDSLRRPSRGNVLTDASGRKYWHPSSCVAGFGRAFSNDWVWSIVMA